MINEHLTFGDQELALSLINVIDSFKSLEVEGMQEVSDAAFDIDNKISFIITGSLCK